MKKSIEFTYTKILCILILLILSPCVFSQESPNPYANTSVELVNKEYGVLKINPYKTNVLAGNLGKPNSNIKDVFKNYMSLWVAAKDKGLCILQWELQVPAEGVYDVIAVVSGSGSNLKIICNGKQLESVFTDKTWNRLNLGKIPLKTGKNILRLEVEATDDFKFSALELTQSSIKKSLLDEALKQRVTSDWFKEASYGVMFQWTNRAAPQEGPIKNWEDKVNDFDVEAFVRMVEATGASYVIWSITWGQQYISAPIKSLDNIIKGRTTKRDLLGEMANLLDEKGIKLIFYYHYGYECYHSTDKDWLEAVGGLKPDKTDLYNNLMTIISEVGERYGDKLHGWWFDGGARYYNCHFDGSSAEEGILTAPFREITKAAKKRNSKRIVAYNSWIKPKVTEYQDYYGGEGGKSFDDLNNGVFLNGRQKGLQAHGCFPLERRWGHIDLNTPITSPKHSIEKLTGFVKKAQENKYPLSINLEMYEDGSVSAESLELLKKLKTVIR